ncbi:MAG TPA: NAD-dependent succinate-semialdehyde dehydrogenase [Bryobacteraceae bacterium]|jgi:succinate-semialdehyde dehydrogenase/glutarate-semialdehyde dehydrogenase|nr:NAD-dependent succinate-semialdehyde dehydrogenase [Bryobacteraceae bacterium]
MAIVSVNPATGEVLGRFTPLSSADVEAKLGRAASTFSQWRKTSFAERAAILRRAAEILESEKRDLGALMTREMGKTLASAMAEAEKCALGCRYYAEHAERFLAAEEVWTGASKSYVQYQPLGVVLAVMPWNFPFWQVFRFAAPALMAGNVGLLKHASNVPQCALAIEDVLKRAGVPEGAFQTLLIEAPAVEALLKDHRVAAATLTGSEPAGRSVAGIAGSVIKKTVLELGGSDPFVAMPSAHLDKTVAAAVKGRVINNGQSCIASKRFIAAASIYDEFERKFTAAMEALRIGDPMDEATELGPLATEKLRSDLDAQVQSAVSGGARVLTGGKPVSGKGNYYYPTVLAGVPRSSPVFYEEIFGPVAMLFRVQDIQEAIDLANDSPFGLGASIWTQDVEEQKRFIDGIESGQVFVNSLVASDPRLPFGGVKRSGYGRELSAFGIREFVNVKTVWIQ